MATSVIAAAESRFEVSLDGTVYDTFTSLTWVKNPATVPSLVGQKSFQDATDACNELVLGGIGPETWRLPRINELKSIVDPKFKNPQINTGIFGAEGSQYWSQTPYSPGARAWTINFKNGALGAYDKYSPDKPVLHHARCVAKVFPR